MPHTPPAVPAFTKWPSFPFEGEFRVKDLEDPVAVEPPRKGEGTTECISCNAPDDAYIWISERWRVRAMDRPSGLPIVLILESRSHLDLGDLPNLLAAELGVMTVRLERAIRSLDGVARVHVNRWGDGSAHLHMWFLARPYGRLQLRGTFLSLWDDILPPIPESQWRENLALVAAWLAEFGGRPLAEPPRIQWQAPSSLTQQEAQAAEAPQMLSDSEPGMPESSPESVEGSVAGPTHAGLGQAGMVPGEMSDTQNAAEPATGESANGESANASAAAPVAGANQPGTPATAPAGPAPASTAEPATVPPGTGSADAGEAAAQRADGERTDAVRTDPGPLSDGPEGPDSADGPEGPDGQEGSPGEASAAEAATGVPAEDVRPTIGGVGNPVGPVADTTTAGRREAEGGLPVPR